MRSTRWLAVLLLTMGLTGGPGFGPAPALADAQFITDEQGRALILHGVNLSGSAKGDPLRLPWVDPNDVQRLAEDWGFNLARYLIFWDAVEPEPGVYGEAYFDRTEERLDWLQQAGIYVVLDMHQDVYSQVFCCDGAPLWAVRVLPGDLPYDPLPQWDLNYFTEPVMRAWDNFWDYGGPHTDLQDHYAAAWARVAERFKDHPAVLGYDIMNEPAAGSHIPFEPAVGFPDPEGTAPVFDQTFFQPFYERVIASIRSVDPDGWIFYEPRYAGPANGAPSFLGVMDDPREGENRLAYFPHYYPIGAELGQSYLNQENVIANWVTQRTIEIDAQQAPLLLGEFGIFDGFPYGIEHLQALLTMADQVTSGWAYWSYDKGGGLSPLNSDGTEKEKLSVMVRPYPQRIAGQPLSYAYDPELRVFTLEFEEKTGVSGPTEIYVPATRFYPYGWELEVSDPNGTWSMTWDAEREVVSFWADPGQAQHRVTIAPSQYRISGARLYVRDRKDKPRRRRLKLVSRDSGITTAAQQSPGDPVIEGATLRLFNPSSEEEALFELPASGWKALGNPPGSGGYHYREREGGPCDRVKVRPGKLLKVSCRGSQIGFSLDEATQGSLAVTLQLGQAAPHCLKFGGTVLRDEGTDAKGRGRFKAIDAQVPERCLVPF